MADENSTEMEEQQEQQQPEAQPPAMDAAALAVELEQLRAALKSANKDSERNRRKLQEYEQAEQARRDAELSEAERLKKQLAEAQSALAQAAEQARQTRIRHAVEMAASRLNFHRPEDAHALADLSGVEVGEDGTVSGVDDALKALAKERPYLVKTGPAGGPETPNGGDTRAVSREQQEQARQGQSRFLHSTF